MVAKPKAKKSRATTAGGARPKAKRPALTTAKPKAAVKAKKASARTGVAQTTATRKSAVEAASKASAATELHRWSSYPTREQLQAHIDAFIRALAVADLVTAFTLCPAKLWKKGKSSLANPNDAKGIREFVTHAVFQAMDGQEILEDHEDEIDPSEPKSWCSFLTPPADVAYVDFALTTPADGTSGEVLANVHLLGECTDITGRYDLDKSGDGWMLAFSSFDVM